MSSELPIMSQPANDILYKAAMQLPLVVPFMLGLLCQISLIPDVRQRRGYVAASISGLALSTVSAVLLDQSGVWPLDSRHWAIHLSLTFSAAVSLIIARARVALIVVPLCVIMCAVLVASRYRIDYLAAGILIGAALTALAHGLRRVVLRANAV